MCLAVPLKIIERDEKEGLAEFDGVRRKVRLDFVPQAAAGDYVMAHAGFAIETIREAEAEASRQAFREVLEAAKAV